MRISCLKNATIFAGNIENFEVVISGLSLAARYKTTYPFLYTASSLSCVNLKLSFIGQYLRFTFLSI